MRVRTKTKEPGCWEIGEEFDVELPMLQHTHKYKTLPGQGRGYENRWWFIEKDIELIDKSHCFKSLYEKLSKV